MIGCVRLPTMLSDEFLQAVLADVTFQLGSVAENRLVAADESNIMKFLGFEVVGCILALADVADHSIGFLYCLLDLFVSDHFCLSTASSPGSEANPVERLVMRSSDLYPFKLSDCDFALNVTRIRHSFRLNEKSLVSGLG